jgi:hypothetical protein
VPAGKRLPGVRDDLVVMAALSDGFFLRCAMLSVDFQRMKASRVFE